MLTTLMRAVPPIRKPFLFFTLVAGLAFGAPAGAAVPVIACNQEIRDDDAFLPADLDCTGQPSPPFVFLCNGTLDLQGFTLRAERVVCVPGCRCTFRGPGTIEAKIDGTAKTRVVIKNAVVSNPDGNCVSAGEGRATVVDSTIGPCDLGVGGARVAISGTTISGADLGVVAFARLKMFDSLVTGSLVGIQGPRLSLRDVAVVGNPGVGVLSSSPRGVGGKLVVRGGRVEANGAQGILYSARVTKLRDTSIAANGASGILWDPYYDCELNGSSKIRVLRTSFTGNGSDPSCAAAGAVCVDIDTCTAPDLVDSSCERSHVIASGAPGASWGSCSLD